MNRTLDLSICIVNWNGREMLRDLLRSIQRFGSEGIAIETIVVDNASTDGSGQMITAEFPNIVLIQNETNRGFAAANNQGAQRAHGRLLLILNNDTLVHEGSLRKLVEFLDSHPQVAAVGPRLIGRNNQPQVTGRNLPTRAALMHRILLLRWTGIFRRAFNRYRRPDFDPNRSGPIPQLAAAALLVRRDQFERIGEFDEGYPFGMEDVDLCARLSELGAVYYLADATITHLGRISSRANSPFVYRGYEIGYARYFRKHDPSGIATLVYKLMVTADLPVRVIYLLLQSIGSLIRNDREGASRAINDVRSVVAFVPSLFRLWTA